MTKLYKKLVLLQYDNCGPFVQIVTSSKPITLKQVAKYYETVDGADWDHDSLTILNDGELSEIDIDRKLEV
jgi:hypothetical protein